MNLTTENRNLFERALSLTQILFRSLSCILKLNIKYKITFMDKVVNLYKILQELTLKTFQ